MFDEFEPISIVYGVLGLLMGIVIIKFSGVTINIFWKILTVLVCGVGAFILGMIQSGD